MSEFDLERTLDRATPLRSLPQQVPEQLWRYALAFLQLQRAGARFYWRDDARWLAVELRRSDLLEDNGAVTERVSVRVAEVEPPNGITNREFDVLTLVTLGLTNGGIAERLGTSARTVSTQIEALLEKLDQGTRGGLAALAVDRGLLRLPLPGGDHDASSGITVTELERAYRRAASGASAPRRTFVTDRTPIRIGVLVPEGASGDSRQLLNGSELAVKEINELGGIVGRRVELVPARVAMFDWASVSSGLDALARARVDALVTGYVSAEHAGFLDRAADLGVPVLHTATYDADLRRVEADQGRYGLILQTCASEIYYVPGMLRLLGSLEALGAWRPRTRRIVAVQQESPSMRLVTDEARAAAATQGWELGEPVTTSVEDTDWPGVIRRAAEQDPDVLFVTNFVERELVRFQDALLREPIPALVYCTYTPSVPSFLQELGAKADGVIWATTTGTYDDELGRRFRARYRQQFGVEPGWSQAGSAYDQVMMLAAAWASVDAGEVDGVVRYIRRWPHRGVNGVYYYAEQGSQPLLYPDTTSDAALSQAHLVYQLQRGRQVLLAPELFGSASRFEPPAWVAQAAPRATGPKSVA